MAASQESGPLASHYINGVYIPSTLLIFAVALVKIQYTPIAIAVAAVLAGYQYFVHNAGMTLPSLHACNGPY